MDTKEKDTNKELEIEEIRNSSLKTIQRKSFMVSSLSHSLLERF